MGNGNKGKSPINNESESSPFHATSTTIRLSESLRSGISGLGGFLRLRDNITITDPKLIAARQMVEDALTAERLADKALMEARNKVREAKEHVRNLEQEAHEEAMRAKARHAEAKMVSKSAKGLGKYG
ncbi:hypothetical protein AMATHDRAFT_146954 [Amanita thiersii Skay4041]|uniref:Uncharacterized protein n=1 Tax=Amanita thiersii Skay4041 TaxID=703135 RepID=A0A2A9NI48_9AGAR|nr:hypothetical protein AMATHDRAFT_146954 [Amanita thiersii Skay4041]